MPWADQDRAATESFLRAARRQSQANNGAQFAVMSEERIAGVIGVHWIKWTHGTTSLGYWLDEDEQGKGLVTRSVSALLDHAFGDWGLHRVEIRAAPENHRSRAIPDRLGFSKEGILRDNERIGDRFVDHVVYSMLASEWLRG
jgi:ribosomal-protein-serine acetyltransferase